MRSLSPKSASRNSKTLPDTDQLLKRGEWNIGFSNIGIPVYNGLPHLNGAYTYRVTPWLALGEGAGLRVVMTDIAVQLFARIQTEVPQWKVYRLFLFWTQGVQAARRPSIL